MKNFILTIILLIAGVIVFTPLFAIGVIYTFFKHLIKLDYSINRQFLPLINSLTLLFDGLANAGAGELLNDSLRIKGKIKYGNWNETISAVTGLISIYEKKTKLFYFLNKVLGKDHCINAISTAQKYYYQISPK